MKLNTVLAALTAASSAAAYKVPEGAPDGLYIAYTNPQGAEVHEAVDSFESVPDVDAAAVQTRSYPPATVRSLTARLPDGQTHCGCGNRLAGGLCDDAVADLKHQLGRGASVKGNLSYYAVRGSVVAFVCNSTPFDAQVRSDDCSESLTRVTSSCGYYIAGTYDYGGIRIGYMTSDQNWCDNAVRSGANRC